MTEIELPHTTLSPRREVPSGLLASTSATPRPPSVTIDRSPAEVHAFVRELTHFPKFMRGCKKAEAIGPRAVRLAFDHDARTETCDVERTSEPNDTVVSWRALDASTVDCSGAFSIEPAPGQRGTVVSLRLEYDKEVQGKVRGMLSYFTGRDPKNESYINLRRLKAYLETGEVPTVQGQPSGRDQ